MFAILPNRIANVFDAVDSSWTGRFTRVNGILLSLLGSSVIKIRTEPIRDAQIRLCDVPEHLGIELLLQVARRFENLVRVRVFGFQMARYRGVGFIAQPKVIVGERLTVNLGYVRPAFGHGSGRDVGVEPGR
jgi:hypothetical protein